MAATDPPGELIGAGRECDIFDAGPGRVLRRARDGRSTEHEALTMIHVAAHGYPVPEVFDASGPDIVMERLVGPTMVDAFAKQPSKVRPFAHQVADLINRLGEIPLPDHELKSRVPAGPTLLHLDLHPLNVLVTDRGPVVIDWTAATAGNPGMDTANTWLIVSAGQIAESGLERRFHQVGRAAFLRFFLSRSDVAEARRQLSTVFEYRSLDSNLSQQEIAIMRTVVATHGV